jgi:sensor histidine kinase YesM
MNKHKAYWICQIGGWSLYAFLNIYILKTADKLTYNLTLSLLVESLYYLFSTHLFRLYIIEKGWLKLYISRLLSRLFIAILILSASSYIYRILVAYSLNLFDFQREFTFLFVFFDLTASLSLYIVWVLFYFMYHYVENYNTALRFDAAINEIELNKLKSQLNPHFIFNALNSIRALVDENPGKSKIAITQLSNILRNSLMMDKKKLINFEDEMKTVRDYLDFDIQEGSFQFEVPPLMVQTLVENGIKHGISTLVEGGIVQICTQVKDSRLLIKIRNSGQYKDVNLNKKEGYGIENTKQRLKLIFGNTASFTIYNENEHFVLTELEIPQSF